MKECGSCTKCCEGSLSVAVQGTDILGKGCPLVLLNKGCGDYENRPVGCVTFKCGWLLDPSIPDYIKPSESNVIIVLPVIDGIRSMGLVSNTAISQSMIEWSTEYANNNGLALRKDYIK